LPASADGLGMDCGVCSPVGDIWKRAACGGGGVGGGAHHFSHESEHDLAAMVSDFLENGSGGADTWCSSDSESGFSDLVHLADKISVLSLSKYAELISLKIGYL